jgi:hypothetical protein
MPRVAIFLGSFIDWLEARLSRLRRLLWRFDGRGGGE